MGTREGVARIDLAGRPDARLASDLRALIRGAGTRRVVIDVGVRRTLPADLAEEIVRTHRALEAAGGRCALVLGPALAAQISAAYPEGLLCAATPAIALTMLNRRGVLLDVRVARGRRRVTLRLVGELDVSGLPAARAALDQVATDARAGMTVRLDLAGLEFVDVAGLRAIIEAAVRCDLAGARTRMEGLQPQTLRLLEHLGWSGQLESLVASDGFQRTPLGWLNRPETVTDTTSAPLPFHRSAAVISTDLDGVVTDWNEAAQRLYGWSRDEVVGRLITTLTVGPEDGRLAREVMETVRRTGVWEGEFDVRRKDGTTFRAHVRDYVLKDSRGRPTGLVGISTAVAEELRTAVVS